MLRRITLELLLSLKEHCKMSLGHCCHCWGNPESLFEKGLEILLDSFRLKSTTQVTVSPPVCEHSRKNASTFTEFTLCVSIFLHRTCMNVSRLAETHTDRHTHTRKHTQWVERHKHFHSEVDGSGVCSSSEMCPDREYTAP